jgi:hypothetical protein
MIRQQFSILIFNILSMITNYFKKNCNFKTSSSVKVTTNNKKQLIMKRNFTLVLTVAVVALVLASCGSGRTASCDAYGSVQQTESSDLASK